VGRRKIYLLERIHPRCPDGGAHPINSKLLKKGKISIGGRGGLGLGGSGRKGTANPEVRQCVMKKKFDYILREKEIRKVRSRREGTKTGGVRSAKGRRGGLRRGGF